MEIVVTGIGLISSLGALDESWHNLLLGKSGIKSHQPFPELPPLPLGLIRNTPTLLHALICGLAHQISEDANLPFPVTNCGVVIGSSRSYQAIWEQWERQFLQGNFSTNSWLNHLPNQVAVSIACYLGMNLGTKGTVLSPMAACATGIWAIAQGYELLYTGKYQKVIVGAIEAPITPLTLAGYSQMGALAKTGCYPFDKHREGLVIGEGGAIFCLESAESAKKRNAKIYGQILGFGLTCDAYHVTTPAGDGKMASVAIKQCLERSQLKPSDIDYIHAHGTSTILNDQREAQIINSLFPQGVAISATKGATGHTLGASGALDAAFCLMALKHQQLPPCVGLKDAAFDLNLVSQTYETNLNNALCFSFGFGGQNAVVAFGKY